MDRELISRRGKLYPEIPKSQDTPLYGDATEIVNRVLPPLPAGVSAALENVRDGSQRDDRTSKVGPYLKHPMSRAMKIQFVQNFISQGFRFIATCDKMKLKPWTVRRYVDTDAAFKDALTLATSAYVENVEAVSRIKALDPNGVIDRMFQLKHLRPEVWSDNNQNIQAVQINMTTPEGVR